MCEFDEEDGAVKPERLVETGQSLFWVSQRIIAASHDIGFHLIHLAVSDFFDDLLHAAQI